MNATDFRAVAYDSDVWCVGCLPDDVTPQSEGATPIFASDEADEYPVCTECGKEHTYINLTEDGRKRHRFEQTEIHTWFERDRAHVELRSKKTEETIVEWWDEDVRQAVEDGFLSARAWHVSAYAYAAEHGLLIQA